MAVPLRINVLFQPAVDSDAVSLADHLYETFSGRPTGRAARIPVRFSSIADEGRAIPDLDDAEHTVVVVLADEHMTVGVGPNAVRRAWEQRVLAIRAACEANPAHVFLPVAVDAAAFDLSDEFSGTSFVRLEHRTGASREQHLVLHVATRAYRALLGQGIGTSSGDTVPSAPVKVFVSHAKQDLGDGYADGPVKAVLALASQAPVDGWYDAAKVDAGSSFRTAIEKGVAASDVLIAVITDAWSDREWCRRELLQAKAAGAPIVIVNALQQGCTRLFPYVGNAPTVGWRAAALDGPAEDVAHGVHRWWTKERERIQAQDAKKVLIAALTEALRHRVDRLRLVGYATDDDVVLGGPPEALTVAALRSATRAWYPDPPLGREELDAVRGERPREFFQTPLSALARWGRPASLDVVAVSLSGSPDSARYGGSPKHLASLSEDLVLYMLLAGLRVCFGGMISHGALNKEGATVGDEIDYVRKLFAQVRSHAPLASEIDTERYHPILNVVAWPIWLGYGHKEYRAYGREAQLYALPRPDGVPDPGAGKYFAAGDLESRYAWCRSLTAMREKQIGGDKGTGLPPASARVALGGKLQGSVSRYPGVLEEILLSLRVNQPLYLIGTFGGAARLVIDQLTGVERPELTTAWFERNHVPEDGDVSWPALVARYRRDDHAIEAPEELQQELAGYRSRGVAASLDNGLTDEQNRELFTCDDPQRAISLILQGMRDRFS